jgi:hypothetical protein
MFLLPGFDRAFAGFLRGCALFAVALVALQSLGQDSRSSTEDAGLDTSSLSTPAAISTDDELTTDRRESRKQERRARSGSSAPESNSTLYITGNRDGTIEVRNSAGELVQKSSLEHFPRLNRVSEEAIERIRSKKEGLEQDFTERELMEKAEEEKAMRAAEEEAERRKKLEEEAEARWQENFASTSESYYQKRRKRDSVKAVRIDAREIRDDGTYLYEGREMKPIRLWNTQRRRYEMAIPVESP